MVEMMKSIAYIGGGTNLWTKCPKCMRYYNIFNLYLKQKPPFIVTCQDCELNFVVDEVRFEREVVPPSKKDTDLEKRTEQYLNELCFKEHEDYEKQYNVSRYWIDFAFVNEKVAIEPGADYWHAKERDAGKENALNERGWKVLWFNEDDINQDEDRVKRMIQEAIAKERGRN